MTVGRQFYVWAGTAAVGAALVGLGMYLLSKDTNNVAGAAAGLPGLMLAVLGLVQTRRLHDAAHQEPEAQDSETHETEVQESSVQGPISGAP